MFSKYWCLYKWLKQAEDLIENGYGNNLARLNKKNQLVADKYPERYFINQSSSIDSKEERKQITAVCLKVAQKADQIGCIIKSKVSFTDKFSQFYYQSASIEDFANMIKSLIESSSGKVIEAVGIIERSINSDFSSHCNEISELAEDYWIENLQIQLYDIWKQFDSKNSSDNNLGYFKEALLDITNECLNSRVESNPTIDKTLVNSVRWRISNVISNIEIKKQKEIKYVEWDPTTIKPSIVDSDLDCFFEESCVQISSNFKSISFQYLIDSGLLSGYEEYEILRDNFGSTYIIWPGFESRLEAFRVLQSFNSSIDNDDFAILMKSWSKDEQDNWCDIMSASIKVNNNKSSIGLLEAYRKVFITLGRNKLIHSEIIDAIQYLDIKTLSDGKIMNKLNALNTLSYGVSEISLGTENIVIILNDSLLDLETMNCIFDSWDNVELLKDILNSLIDVSTSYAQKTSRQA